MVSPYFSNSCWMLSCFREAQAYYRASRRVKQTQLRLFNELVSGNKDTWFGKHYCFSSVKSIKDFQRAVPLSTYEDYTEPVQKIARGASKILTSESVELLEPTSGSTSGEKLIPYTAGLRRSFQRAIRVWIWDLFSNRPGIRAGKAYWSISPLAHAGRTTEAGIPIGFDDDAGYLGSLERRLLANSMAVPPEVALCRTVPLAQYATLFFLLRSANLSLISVWSPTFLEELLNSLQVNWEQLCDDIERGSITLEQSHVLPNSLRGSFGQQPNRAMRLRAVMNHSQQSGDWIKQIWPYLSMVSCWADGPSAVYANNLRHSLTDIEMQPKGLLATEAFVSIPQVLHQGAGLAIRSHFFEFQHVAADGVASGDDTVLADELELGKRYQVIVSTEGGLYRYQMMDQVEVVGFNEQIPQLAFVGKSDDTTDLVGEKLNSAHVQSVLEFAFNKHALAPTYYELIANSGGNLGYVLRIADARLLSDKQKQADLCASIDCGLRSNPGYRYAQDLGQLSGLQIEGLDQENANRLIAQRTSKLLRSGMRLGDVKPRVLSMSDAYASAK